MLKSRSNRYGSVAVSLHWLSAIAILALLATGFRAAGAVDPAVEAELLRLHVPLGITVLLLTLARLGWWLFVDRKPAPITGTPPWQDRLARTIHVAFYVILFGMVGSGIALMVLSGAGAVLISGTGTLPDFPDFAPFAVHGIGAMSLIALLVLHIGAALYHQFIRRDGIFRRMWYGRGEIAAITED